MAELSQLEILEWLREGRPARLQSLYEWGDAVRRQHVGDAVHMRGLIEISSHCARQCMYCGLRQGNRRLRRYRMTQAEIVACVRQAERLGYGTVVMQAGEDDMLTAEGIAEIVRWIKRETALAVTLSLGERREDELRLWREAGADRYLLRFETSDEKLFLIIHSQRFSGAPDRMMLLRRLKDLGYEAGGGGMVGIPGQSFASLTNDILAFRAMDQDMIGIGPYIPHADTPLGSGALQPEIAPDEQVPNRAEMVYKAIALTRICPTANFPSTTALATINKVDGRKQGLSSGANVVMPNLTPEKYRRLYQIYPDKACIEESAERCHDCLGGQIHSLGRFAGRAAGFSQRARADAERAEADLGFFRVSRGDGHHRQISSGMPVACFQPSVSLADALQDAARALGEEIAIVFIGPCIAKTREGEAHPELLDVVLTFEDLDRWLTEENIHIEETVETQDDRFAPEEAQEGGVIPFSNLFSRVLESSEDIVGHDIRYRRSILNTSIFTIEPHSVVGGIFQDITEPSFQKEQIIGRAQEVIQKNLKTVQQVAYLLGENAADSEIILNSVVRSFSPEDMDDSDAGVESE